MLLVLEIALEDAAVPDEDLPILSDLYIRVREASSHGAQLEVLRIGDVGDTGGFGEPVSLPDGDADALEELEDLM